MLSYCLKCQKIIHRKFRSKVLKTKKLEQCIHQSVPYAAVKKSRFKKEQEAGGL